MDPNYLNWSTHKTFPFIHMDLAWCCWQEFCFCRSWFPCRIQELLYPAFQHIDDTVLRLHSLLEDRYRQQTASYNALVLQWTLATVRCQLLSASSSLSATWSYTDCRCCVIVVLIILSGNILNSTWDNGHTCRTPTVVRTKSPTLPFSNTALVDSAYKSSGGLNQPAVAVKYSFKTRLR